MRLSSQFKELLSLLNSSGVEYLLVGGYAVAHHGYPRPTGDMVLWVRRDRENAGRIATALARFGFPTETEHLEWLTEENRNLRMGVRPQMVEFLTSIDGVESDDCYPRRVLLPIDEIIVPVIDREDLIRNKRASGRFKDLADLEELEL